MKKILAFLLSFLLALSAPMALAEPVPEYNELIVGSTTALSGKFFTDMWGSNTADMDVRALIHGYDLVEWATDLGTYVPDGSVVSGIMTTQDEAGNRSFIIALYEDLTYSDGTPITAWDYAFSILLSLAPEMEQIGAAVNGSDHILGSEAYRSGAARALSGVTVQNDYLFTITVKAEYFPYFYEMTLMDYQPYPISEIAPGCEVADDGNGVYIRNMDQTIEEPIFTAELLQETILNPETGYMVRPAVSCGPYVLVDYDAEAGIAEFAINRFFKGNSAGELPLIPSIILRPVSNETMIAQLESGEIGLLNKCVAADNVDAGMALVTQDLARVNNYARSGYSFISFNCEQSAVSSQKVRQAIAMSFDKDAFIAEYVRNYGLRVDGYYGIGQWMYRLVAGSLAAPISEPAPDASDAELEAYEAEVLAWQDLGEKGLSEQQVYTLDDASAVDLLVEDGWILNREGKPFDPAVDDVRCKEIEGELVALDLQLIYPEGNAFGDIIQTTLVDKLAPVGVKLNVEAKPFTELLKIYYRQTERDCDMIYLASNFASVFDPSSTFSPEDAFQGEDNRTGIVDEHLYQLAVDLRETDPGDVLGYCQKWIAFQEYYAQALPTIPVYSNVYFDFYTPTLHNYTAGADVSWAEAIVGAYMGDPEMLEEEAAGEAEGDIFEDEFEDAFID